MQIARLLYNFDATSNCLHNRISRDDGSCWLRSTQDSSKEASRFVDRPDRLRSGLASHLYFGRGRRRRIWVGISPIDGSNGSVELFLGGTSLRNFGSVGIEHT